MFTPESEVRSVKQKLVQTKRVCNGRLLDVPEFPFPRWLFLEVISSNFQPFPLSKSSHVKTDQIMIVSTIYIYIYIPTYTIVDCSIIATSRQKKKDDKVHAKTVTTLIKMNQDLRGGLETCNCRWYAALDRNVPHIIPWSDKNSQLLIINKAPCGAVCLGFQKKKSKMQKWRFWWLTRLQTFVSGS